MFNWTAFPESIDSNYEDMEATAASSPPAPSIAPPSQPAPQPPLSTSQHQQGSSQMLPRSASTSQIASPSLAAHFETASGTFPVSAGSRSNQPALGSGSQSEASSPMLAPATRLLSSSRSGTGTLGHESMSNGLRAPPSSSEGGTFNPGLPGARGVQRLPMPSLEGPVSSSSWWFQNSRSDLPDFVLISEFSEVEGPRAVMTIPDNVVDLTHDSYSMHKQQSQEGNQQDSSDSALNGERAASPKDKQIPFDIHEFVLRITSVDQQAKEASGSFHIPEDIEVHISDEEKGYWAYVHHFTLFDINARGFVRPFSVSYITRDPHKIMMNYEALRQKFGKAILHFKTGNYTLFRQDLTKKLRDLNYTNNILSGGPPDSASSNHVTPTGSPKESSGAAGISHDAIAQSAWEGSGLSELASPTESLSESQKTDLESIRDAIETATHIISVLEHYSIDGQPLLGHGEEGSESAQSMPVPMSDLSPMTSSENLALLASGRAGLSDPSLFLGTASRPGSRIRRKGSTPSVGGNARILDHTGSGNLGDGVSAPIPQLLGLQQQDQSRKNSVVSDYDTMFEAPEYEAQYVTTLYPIFRDEVVFRPLRELCIATLVWNSSIQFHLGIKKMKDILKDFQADSLLLGEAADNLKRMNPTASSVTIGKRFQMNFRNPDFNRLATRPSHQYESHVPLVELLQGISLASAHSEDGLSVVQEKLVSNPTEAPPAPRQELDSVNGERKRGLEGEDADDEETGYDSLDDAASFFTAITGLATHTDTPTRDAFGIAPLDRSARVAEWHQEQQTLHHAKDTAQLPSRDVGTVELAPWSFPAGSTPGELLPATSSFLRTQHRNSGQSGVSVGIVGSGAVQTMHSPSAILEAMLRDPTIAKHLVFALLSGQKVCVMGQSESEMKVRSLVSVLSMFLPHVGYPSREEQLIEHQRKVIPWFQGQGLLKVEDMDSLSMIGVDSSRIDPKFLESEICVLDYDTLTWVNGRQYTDGIFLEAIFRNLSIFAEDTSFLAFVDGKLSEILLKAFLYYHLVLHGRLYHASLLSHPGAQSFYSSGASDDGESFSYQNNFRSSRQSPLLSKSSGISRVSRRDTSAYPSTHHLGATILSRGSAVRSASLSSRDSSDDEKGHHERSESLGGRARRSPLDHTRSEPHFDRRERSSRYGEGVEVSGDESSLSGGPMQYTTSQGMRKWKKWFEYWSAKSVAMIDPALAAFGRQDSEKTLDGAQGRRRRINSGRSSPGGNRRSRNPSGANHPSPSRKEKEKERDRERERERIRKADIEHFRVFKEKTGLPSASDSDVTGDMNDFQDEKYDSSMRSPDHDDGSTDQRVDDTHAALADALTPLNSSPSKSVVGLRRLKPKRPLSLHPPFSKSDGRLLQSSEDRRIDETDQLAVSPPSGSFRSLAGALRSMSFGHSSTPGIVADPPNPSSGSTGSDAHLDVRLSSLEEDGRQQRSVEQISPRTSHDFTDSSLSKDVKRRGSTRAKAKAWLKSKRKRRSRNASEGDLEELAAHIQGVGDIVDQGEKVKGKGKEDSQLEADSDKTQERVTLDPAADKDTKETLDEQSSPPLVYTADSMTTPAQTPSLSAYPSNHSRFNTDLTDMDRPLFPDMTSLSQEMPLTIEEMASREPTRMISPSRPTSAALMESTRGSQSSSANTSRITSPTLPGPSFAPTTTAPYIGHRRLDSLSSVGARSAPRSVGSLDTLSRTISSAPGPSLTTRSEYDDSETDRHRNPRHHRRQRPYSTSSTYDLDPGSKESATEYETSAETFAVDSGGSPRRLNTPSTPGSGPQSRLGRTSLDSLRRSSMEGIRPGVATPWKQKEGELALNRNTLLHQQSQQQLKGQPSQSQEKPISAEKNPPPQKEQVVLTEEEEVIVRELLGGVSGEDDWDIIVHLATMVDKYEWSKDPISPASNEP
ncbi:hypothetical protein EMPS_08751 [Entomortierella parvispora]|uniref:UDENN FLCN/SMCR8-type domain-containing protein n=1 Tax=Entomortierella parvispora TaxID=205924 RepID=A0A9P3HGW3_9FUNG|nr:hypothetical protein EMPS_08751 [Entomortierella parvispora]